MEEQQHKRRVRYKGTHPKTYTEKYKEHHPEKYADTIEKVIRKGSTPAGMHLPIMVQEILDFLQIKPGQKGLDATLGYGGHTRKMLEQLQGTGHKMHKRTFGTGWLWHRAVDHYTGEFCEDRPDCQDTWTI